MFEDLQAAQLELQVVHCWALFKEVPTGHTLQVKDEEQDVDFAHTPVAAFKLYPAKQLVQKVAEVKLQEVQG